MLAKIWNIAWTQVYIAYSDRGALILMLVVPVAISLIIGLAFGTDSNDIDPRTADLVIINLDEGATLGTGAAERQENYGDFPFASLLAEDIPSGLQPFVNGQISTTNNIDAARSLVEDGDFDALLIIPASFTADVIAPDRTGQLELYYNPGDNIRVSVLISIIERFTTNLNAGRVAENLLLGDNDGYFIELAQQSGNFQNIETAATEALPPLYAGEGFDAITLNSVDVEGDTQEFDSLQYFAPSMAILFMTFAMAAGTKSILEDRENWTMQRILSTPTPRWAYLAGKMLGTYITGLLQMLMLIVIMQVVANLLGRSVDVWGTNYLGIVLIVLAVVAAATGLGVLIAAFAKDSMQADSIASTVIIVMAVAGGAFIPVSDVPILDAFSNLSLNRWGVDGFIALSSDNAAVSELGTPVLVLLVMAIAYFALALVQFNRRLDI